MGWIALAGLAALAALLLLRFAKLPRAAVELSGAVLVLAVVGYAAQGRPAQPSAPASNSTRVIRYDPAAVELRRAISGRFSGDAQWLDYADTLTRYGQTRLAVLAMRSAIRRNPKSADLWVGLGNALVAHGDGVVSPAADFAFRRAGRLSPLHPAPPFFLGLALAQGGRPDEAVTLWRRLAARTSVEAPWRAELVTRLAALEASVAAVER